MLCVPSKKDKRSKIDAYKFSIEIFGIILSRGVSYWTIGDFMDHLYIYTHSNSLQNIWRRSCLQRVSCLKRKAGDSGVPWPETPVWNNRRLRSQKHRRFRPWRKTAKDLFLRIGVRCRGPVRRLAGGWAETFKVSGLTGDSGPQIHWRIRTRPKTPASRTGDSGLSELQRLHFQEGYKKASSSLEQGWPRLKISHLHCSRASTSRISLSSHSNTLPFGDLREEP